MFPRAARPRARPPRSSDCGESKPIFTQSTCHTGSVRKGPREEHVCNERRKRVTRRALYTQHACVSLHQQPIMWTSASHNRRCECEECLEIVWRRQFEWGPTPQTVTSATSERESQGCPERTHRKELDAEIEAQVVGHKTLQIGRFIRQRPKQD